MAQPSQDSTESCEAALIRNGFSHHPLDSLAVFQEASQISSSENRRMPRNIIQEYYEIDEFHRKRIKTNPTLVITSADFAHKNRYRNILPLADSAVQLIGTKGDPVSQYINANFISDELILTQGPTTETIGDFWAMVLERGMSTIVMLTRLYDGGGEIEKCTKYWSDENREIYSGITVELKDIASSAKDAITLRIFEVSKGEKRTRVKHIQYEGWPDHGVPQSYGPILRVLSLSMEYSLGESEHIPSVVAHCSAGVGRSGAFALVYYAIGQLYRLSKQGIISLGKDADRFTSSQLLHHLRERRMMTIQSPEQYLFGCSLLQKALEHICKTS